MTILNFSAFLCVSQFFSPLFWRRVSIAGNNRASRFFPHWCDLPQHFRLFFSTFLHFRFIFLVFISALCLAHIFIFYFPASDFFSFVNLCAIKAEQIYFTYIYRCACVCVFVCLLIHEFYFDPSFQIQLHIQPTPFAPVKAAKQINKLKLLWLKRWPQNHCLKQTNLL